MAKKHSKEQKIGMLFGRFLTLVVALFLGTLLIGVSRILPFKYMLILGLFSLAIVIIFGILLWKQKDMWFLLVTSIFGILICIGCFVAFKYLSTTYNFLDKLKANEYEKINYNVVVLKENNFSNIYNLKGEKIALLNENSDNIIKTLSDVITFQTTLCDNAGILLDGLYESEYKAIIIDDDVLDVLKEDNGEIKFDDVAKVLYTFQVETKVSNKEVEKVNISKDSIIVYISGIDQYGKVSTVRGRSDVNMIIAINPKTSKILLLNTPRDYYVQLHDRPGLRDKLTHAGVYGIDLSVSTLEDLYDIKIDYYLRVNFDTVIQLVDVIGGVDVYSDTTFYSSHINGWLIKEGMNNMDGKKALAYSRERYAYITGDRHRGQNQQDVIAAIIKKTTNSKVLLSKYNEILDTLSESFQSNIPSNTITDFIKYQINEMPNWSIEQISVSGSDAYDYTYSFGERQKLYVMVPYENDITMAKTKLNEVLNG